MATYTKGSAPQSLRVADTMAKQVFSCRADDSLDAAEHLMSGKQIRRIPVVDGDNRPMGLLSLNDGVRHAAKRKTDGLDREIVVRQGIAVIETRAALRQRDE